MEQDKAIVTMADQYSHTWSIEPMTLNDHKPKFQGQAVL